MESQQTTSFIPDSQQEQMEDMDSLFPDDPGIGLGELDDFDEDEDPLDDYYEDEDWDEDEEDDGPDYDSDEGWDPFD